MGEAPGPWARALVLMGVAAYSALILASSTRWLVIDQLAMGVTPSGSLSAVLSDVGVRSGANPSAAGREAEAMRRAAARHSHDYRMQLAAVTLGREVDTASALRSMIPAFPASASLRANILRVACIRDMRVNRPEEQILSARSPISTAPWPPTDQSALAAFDHDALAAEWLDPENGFLPFMRAAGLFAAHRDEEALAAIRRASTKPHFQDYTGDWVEGKWRLMQEASGNRSAVARATVAASLLLPHYGPLRAAARVATYLAMQDEMQGKAKDGIAIRAAVSRCGSLMRVESGSIIGSLVGIAITNLSWSRPGGAPRAHRWESGEERGRQRLDAYVTYLEGNGEPGEANWAKAEFGTGEQVRKLAQGGFAASPFGTPMVPLILLWVVDLLILANVLSLLALGLAGAYFSEANRWRALAPFAVTVVLIGFAFLAAFAPWAEALDSLRGVLLGLTVASAPMPPQSPADLVLRLLAFPAIRAVIAVAAPCLLLFALILARAIRRVPLSHALAFGLRRTAIPFACLALLLYAGMAVRTVERNEELNHSIRQALHREGPYMAAARGQAWPGPAR